MKIKSVQIKDYKRFHDLTIQSIPEAAKLVVLAGPNGFGKSSLFDAMMSWHRAHSQLGSNNESLYYKRTPQAAFNINASHGVLLEFYTPFPTDLDDKKRALYLRSAYRNDPDFNVVSLGKQSRELDNVRFHRMIENDAAVSTNYSTLMGRVLEAVIKTPELTGKQIIGEQKDKINNALKVLFDESLTLTDLGNPTENGAFYFTKGTSSNFHYKNLSGGEKAAFDLILDLSVKVEAFNNTVFCIDEPETHLNTRIQQRLLTEILKLIPDNCQLWIATHAIGMMRAARDLWLKSNDAVCFIDFEGKDFDQVQILEPIKPTRVFWERILKVALDDLASLVAPQNIVVCEGTPRSTPYSGANADHDSQCYNSIFATSRPDTLFISGGNAKEVVSDHYILVAGLNSAITGVTIIRLVDRDAQSEQEIEALKKQNTRVLSQRHLEGYLWSEEILTKLCNVQGRAGTAVNILAERTKLIDALKKKGEPEDDIKAISGLLYVTVKKTLGLHAHGNNARAFMRDTLSLLVTPDTNTYKEIDRDIFG